MESRYPPSHVLSSSIVKKERSTKWTKEENVLFESALAIFDTETPDRWINVASLIPGKSVHDVKKQYEELEADISDIEAGLVPVPGYLTSSFTMELVDNRSFHSTGKRSSIGRSCDQERKKGVPWTEEEHRRFLMGLQMHGKGDWRNISRNCVITKTPTQVASHAQKYYARQHSEGKEKRRPSIHDITTANLADQINSSDSNRFHKSTSIPSMQTPKVMLDWNKAKDGTTVFLDDSSHHGHTFTAYPFQIASQGLKLQKNGGSESMFDLAIRDMAFSRQGTKFTK